MQIPFDGVIISWGGGVKAIRHAGRGAPGADVATAKNEPYRVRAAFAEDIAGRSSPASIKKRTGCA